MSVVERYRYGEGGSRSGTGLRCRVLEWITDSYQLHTFVLLALCLHCSRKELEELGGEIRACECFCVSSSVLA